MTGNPISERRNPLSERRLASHLTDGKGWEASELEYGMVIADNAFTRWMSLSLTAAGNADLAPLEILVLHNTNHRSRETPYAICFLLNIEDTHTVNYALSKLLKLGLLEADNRGQPAGDVGAVRSSQPCSSAAETGHVARKIAGTMSRRSSQFLKLRT